ncbi:F510_1955 family glycosylhydrolase [Nesterenkonia halophila]
MPHPAVRPSRALGGVSSLLVAGLLSACSSSGTPDESGGGGAASSGADGPSSAETGRSGSGASSGDVAWGHVHGLGVDGDGAVLVATHHGLHRLGEGGSELISEVQDFMGFTAVEEGRYLASGHPGAEQDGPANLGLISSDDGGAEWSEVSLGGEADFHALDAAEDRVYGVDSVSGGTLMVSDDAGESWTRREAPAMADLAVAPQDPQRLVATTQEGLMLSEDAGRTFSRVDGAPLLQLVDWASDGTLVGLAPDGSVHRAVGGDLSSWEHRWQHDDGGAAVPAAVHAVDAETLHVALDTTVYGSTDGGESFAPLGEG